MYFFLISKTGSILHFRNDSHFLKAAYQFHTNKTAQNNPFETQFYFDTDFDHTHENPSKIPLLHNPKNHQNHTKYSQTHKNQALHRISQNPTINTETTTNIHTNVNTTKPCKIQILHVKIKTKNLHKPLSHRNPKITNHKRRTHHEPKLHIQNHANTQIQSNQPYNRRDMSCHSHK